MGKDTYVQSNGKKKKLRFWLLLIAGCLLIALIVLGLVTKGRYWGIRDHFRKWLSERIWHQKCPQCSTCDYQKEQKEIDKLKADKKWLRKQNDSLRNLPPPKAIINTAQTSVDTAAIIQNYLAQHKQVEKKEKPVMKKKSHHCKCKLHRRRVYHPY